MKYKLINKCRNCSSNNLFEVVNLGFLAFTGKFWKNNKPVPKAPLVLIKCTNCQLTQLKHNFMSNFLFSSDYGYRSGINHTMRKHLFDLVKKIKSLIKFNKNDIVLDIASNDGTLLNSYKNKNLKTFGIDPLINKFKKSFYFNVDFVASKFFSKEAYFIKTKKKAKVITAVSVFYDLPDPNKFLFDIKSILDNEGIFIMEQSDLYLMLKRNSIDTICHEHLEYYSIYVIQQLLNKNDLRIFKHEFNDINGGSSRFYICHKQNKNFTFCEKKINLLIIKEKNYGLFNNKAFYRFKKRINILKDNIEKKLLQIKKKNNLIHGYGASTKGNVTLQLFNIGKYIDFISDRNHKKNNLYTPGSNIKIITENASRNLNPNYYLVLPWHFKEEILKREKTIRARGTRFIFPFPQLKII